MRRTATGRRAAHLKRSARTRSAATRRAAKIAAIPEGYHTVTPHLTVRGAAEAIDFYCRFPAAEIARCAKFFAARMGGGS